MKQNIDFRQVRDFGELVNDTFAFAKQNFRPLLKSIFAICGFFLVASAVAGILYALRVQDALQEGSTSTRQAVFSWEYFIDMAFMMLFYTSLTLTVTCYIDLYVRNGNQVPQVEEVWTNVKYYFFRVLGSGILLVFMTIIAFFLCIIPGFYLWPITSLILVAIVFENCSFGYAYRRGFRLIKGSWWTTFGALFIVSLIMIAATMAVVFPVGILTAGTMFFTKSFVSTPILILNTALQSLSQVFYFLPYVVVSLSYFSLVEAQEGTGLLERIESIGEDKPDNDLPEEQY